MKRVKIIGLTGGIGSGKSTVAAMLAEMSAHVINADIIAHGLLCENQAVITKLVKHFDTEILYPNGTINRGILAKRAFCSHYETKFLNQTLHPLIRKRLEEAIHTMPKEENRPLVIEAPLLIEAGWTDLVDTIWVTEAPLEIRLSRLEKRGLPRQEAIARIKEQTSDEKRREFAHVLINTNVDLSTLKVFVTRSLDSYMAQGC